MITKKQTKEIVRKIYAKDISHTLMIIYSSKLFLEI